MKRALVKTLRELDSFAWIYKCIQAYYAINFNWVPYML